MPGSITFAFTTGGSAGKQLLKLQVRPRFLMVFAPFADETGVGTASSPRANPAKDGAGDEDVPAPFCKRRVALGKTQNSRRA